MKVIKPDKAYFSQIGKIGGPARWKNVSKTVRSKLMRKAVMVRWHPSPKK